MVLFVDFWCCVSMFFNDARLQHRPSHWPGFLPRRRYQHRALNLEQKEPWNAWLHNKPLSSHLYNYCLPLVRHQQLLAPSNCLAPIPGTLLELTQPQYSTAYHGYHSPQGIPAVLHLLQCLPRSFWVDAGLARRHQQLTPKKAANPCITNVSQMSHGWTHFWSLPPRPHRQLGR